MNPRLRPRLYNPPDDRRIEQARGRTTHRAIAQLAAVSRVNSADGPIDIVSLVQAAALKERLSPLEADGVRLTAVGHVMTYARWFLPPDPWRLVGTELPCGDSRVDLAWYSPEGLVWDEVKAGGRGVRPGGGAYRQARRYALLGATIDPRFIGVRLIYLGAPRRSVLVHRDGHADPLADTPYWFVPRRLEID